MCRCCHRYKTDGYWFGASKPKNIEEGCKCTWVRKAPRPPPEITVAKSTVEAQMQWWPDPTCDACIMAHLKPLMPGHPQYPPYAIPGQAWFIDTLGKRHKFINFVGPKAAIPDPAVIAAKMKAIEESGKAKLAEMKKERERQNKVADELLAEELKEQAEYEREREAAEYNKRRHEENMIAHAFSVLPGSEL
jgi:hypothetical protein